PGGSWATEEPQGVVGQEDPRGVVGDFSTCGRVSSHALALPDRSRPYRARPRLRRRRSAGLSLRGLGGGLVALRPPTPAVAAAARRRSGARLRASYQMK